MTYRIQIRTGRTWETIGAECLSADQARADVAFVVPRGCVWRIVSREA